MLPAALLLALIAPVADHKVQTVDPALAAKAFADLCLSSSSADEARRAVEAVGFAKGETLPGLMGGAPLETYSRPPLEIGIRQGRSGGSSCMVVFAPDSAADNAAVAGAVTALPGLTLLSSKGSGRKWRATWTPLRAPKGSKVYLTIGDDIGHRGAILTLEAKAKK